MRRKHWTMTFQWGRIFCPQNFLCFHFCFFAFKTSIIKIISFSEKQWKFFLLVSDFHSGFFFSYPSLICISHKLLLIWNRLFRFQKISLTFFLSYNIQSCPLFIWIVYMVGGSNLRYFLSQFLSAQSFLLRQRSFHLFSYSLFRSFFWAIWNFDYSDYSSFFF